MPQHKPFASDPHLADDLFKGLQMHSQKTVHVYVTLLEEGTDTIRRTDALDLGGGLYKLLPTPNYDPEDETWEFPPGTVVKCKITNDYRDKNVLLAFEEVPQI